MKCFKCGFNLSKPKIQNYFTYKFLCIDNGKNLIKRLNFKLIPRELIIENLGFDRFYLEDQLKKQYGMSCDFCGILYITRPSFIISQRNSIPEFVLKNKRKNKYGNRKSTYKRLKIN